MNRSQLYELVIPVLHLLALDAEHTTLCGIPLYVHYHSNCSNCIFYDTKVRDNCRLHLANISAQQLKADIIVKHPELLI